MKRRFIVAAFVSALALAGGTTAPAAHFPSAPVAFAKTCSAGYRHAVIGAPKSAFARVSTARTATTANTDGTATAASAAITAVPTT